MFSRFIAKKNFAFNLTAVKGLIEECLTGNTTGDCARRVDHVKSLERTYWRNEIEVEEEGEPAVSVRFRLQL